MLVLRATDGCHQTLLGHLVRSVHLTYGSVVPLDPCHLRYHHIRLFWKYQNSAFSLTYVEWVDYCFNTEDFCVRRKVSLRPVFSLIDPITDPVASICRTHADSKHADSLIRILVPVVPCRTKRETDTTLCFGCNY